MGGRTYLDDEVDDTQRWMQLLANETTLRRFDNAKGELQRSQLEKKRREERGSRNGVSGGSCECLDL